MGTRHFWRPFAVAVGSACLLGAMSALQAQPSQARMSGSQRGGAALTGSSGSQPAAPPARQVERPANRLSAMGLPTLPAGSAKGSTSSGGSSRPKNGN